MLNLPWLPTVDDVCNLFLTLTTEMRTLSKSLQLISLTDNRLVKEMSLAAI